MSLGVLNNISAIYAQNNLNQSQSSLQKVLTQLSSGSKINSGADDAAGLSIVNGLQANASALTQSSSNASAGVGYLQVADGALSQVTNLLNRAVTLATEAGGGTLSTSQLGAAQQEYSDILTQITTIGSTTNYNGQNVFASTAAGTTTAVSKPTASAPGAALTFAVTQGATLSGNIVITASGASVPAGSQAVINLADYSGLASNDQTIKANAAAALTTALNTGTGSLGSQTLDSYTVAATTTGFTITPTGGATKGAEILTVSTDNASMTTAGAGAVNIFTSDGTASGSSNYVVTVGSLSSSSVGTSASGGSSVSISAQLANGGASSTSNGTAAFGTAGTDLHLTQLDSQVDAQAALKSVTNAINAVAYQRGQVGANINTLAAASNITSAEQTNVVAAENTLSATDYAAATSAMSKFEILTQTGISALAQANSVQQMVTKLLQ